jgi:hypothetical protein
MPKVAVGLDCLMPAPRKPANAERHATTTRAHEYNQSSVPAAWGIWWEKHEVNVPQGGHPTPPARAEGLLRCMPGGSCHRQQQCHCYIRRQRHRKHELCIQPWSKYSLGQKFWQTMHVSQGCKQAEYQVASWSSWLHAVMPALHSHGCRLRVSVRAGAWQSLQNCKFTAKNRPVFASIFSTQQ